ncbi:GNAT family N-acetyltransferase [Chloroflexota bacterium]
MGQFVGYGGVQVQPPYSRVYAWGYVHPDFMGQGIGTELVQRAEARTREILARANVETPMCLEQLISPDDGAAVVLLTGQGYQPVRHFWQMELELTAAPPAPNWPTGITLETLRADHVRAVYDAMDEAFQDHWGYVAIPVAAQDAAFERWQNRLSADPDFDPALVFVALAGAEVAGVAFNRLKFATGPDMGSISSLSVCPPWRRQGLALALLYQTFGAFYRRGYARVRLGVDTANVEAIRLYEKVGMRVTHQQDVYSKELRVADAPPFL